MSSNHELKTLMNQLHDIYGGNVSFKLYSIVYKSYKVTFSKGNIYYKISFFFSVIHLEMQVRLFFFLYYGLVKSYCFIRTAGIVWI